MSEWKGDCPNCGAKVEISVCKPRAKKKESFHYSELDDLRERTTQVFIRGHWSLRPMAKAMGISTATLFRFMNGGAPNFKSFKRIQEWMEV